MTADNYNFSQNKLELVWPGKEQLVRPEPRILIEQTKYSGDQKGLTDNLLIYGDNLLGLKALEHQYAGKVKCIYIDPPYNTKSCFTHYDDSMEHSMWLDMMQDRLLIMHRLLSEDGSIWISIDDGESHYLKVMCDEIFGRKNFIANILWERAESTKADSKFISCIHDHILVYAKKISLFKMNKLIRKENEISSSYNKIDKNGDQYFLNNLKKTGAGNKREDRPNLYYPIIAPEGSKIYPKNSDGSDGRWKWSKDKLEKDKELIEWIKSKNGWSIYYKVYAKNNVLFTPDSIWTHKEVGSNRTSKNEVKKFNQKEVFATPKPEALIHRILNLATNPNDIVLDCFAGSGTTGAVAHKMSRRWIMIEMGEHAKTHIIPRLEKVIEGTDHGGITESVNWKGGGGFRFCEIAPSLLQRDKLGRLVINKQYTPQMLKEAMCLHAGFSLAEHSDAWWCHGQSAQGSYVYVTPETLTRTQLARLSDEVGSERSCLVFCGAFTCASDEFDNLTIQKIPKSILSKCDWDQEDYSLKNKPTRSTVDISHSKKQAKEQNIAAA